MADSTPDILKGTLDLLILQALSWGPAHGYAVARRIELATDDVLVVGEGTLYPALHRLEELTVDGVLDALPEPVRGRAQGRCRRGALVSPDMTMAVM